MMQRIERTFAGRPLIIETGRMAKQAAGSALVTYGETVLLCAVTVSDKKSPLPFFPLTVEYKEKMYASGKIPGGFTSAKAVPATRRFSPAASSTGPFARSSQKASRTKCRS